MIPVAIRKSKPHPTRLRAPRGAALPMDDVELNSDASFPASDAPSWTPVTRIGSPHPSAGVVDLQEIQR